MKRGYTPLEERDEAWYAASAERFNRAEARRVPLLAAMGVAKRYTPEERQAEAERFRANSELIEAASDARLVARATELRAKVGEAVGEVGLAELDAYVAARRYLQSPAYRADFWHGTERRISQGLTPIPTQAEMLSVAQWREIELR